MKNLEKTERVINKSNGEVIFSSTVELNKANMFNLYSVRNVWDVGETGWKIHNTNVVEFKDKKKAKQFYETIVAAIDDELDGVVDCDVNDHELCDYIKERFYEELTIEMTE